jgi:hypothetical protein
MTSAVATVDGLTQRLRADRMVSLESQQHDRR